ncbi:MAG: response regulator transcription factor [Chloroflexota bacterium]|nr:response regulator transcription factor [Chloroflexota bacterium]
MARNPTKMNDQLIPDSEALLLIVAESLLSRAGLSALLDERGCFVLGQVDGVDLQQDLDRLEPDLLVVDMGWDAEQMRERLARIERDIPLLALLADDDEEGLAALFGLLRAFPCFALLLRDSAPDAIVAALAALEQGLTVLDPRLIASLGAATPVDAAAPSNPLTAREIEVLQLLARGLTNRAIAHQLGITQHTVKYHVNAIMGKLDAQSRTEAVVRASQLGMIVL